MKNFIRVDDRIININNIRHVRDVSHTTYKSRIAYIGLLENDCRFDSTLTVNEIATLIEQAQHSKKRKK